MGAIGAMGEATSSPAAFADDAGGSCTTIEDLPADVLALVLRRLDGASLAAVGCASSGLHGLATDPDTWRALCLAMWPSVRDLLPVPCCGAAAGVGVDHRALFADAFPFPSSSSDTPPAPAVHPLPTRLVSAVDLRHAGVSILSRVIDTDASSDWFLGAPFRVDALVQEGFTSPAPSTTISPADLELSWVLLDPSTGRAINASSRRAVAVDRKWLTGDTVARFAIVLSGTGTSGAASLALDASVTCDERYGHVREVSLRVEDADGAGVSGRDGLAAVAAAMAAPRRRGGAKGEEDAARVRYEEFVRGKTARKEWKARRESMLDLCCSGVGAAAFLSFLVMLTFR